MHISGKLKKPSKQNIDKAKQDIECFGEDKKEYSDAQEYTGK